MIDMKKITTFKKLLSYLKLFIKNLNKRCKGCAKVNFHKLYSIGCKPECVICYNCKELLASSEDTKCPVCNAKLGLFEVIETENSANKLKTGLNSFFMETVTDLCFDESNVLPDKEVIDLIIENLMPKSLSVEKDNELILDFNLSPSIKSTLFQILLNYNEKEVESHLNSIFSKSVKFLKENYSSNDLVDLKLIYINSIEDKLYSDHNLNELPYTIEILSELNHLDFDEIKNPIEQFKLIAKIKFVCVLFSKIMNEFDEDNVDQLKFVQMARNFIYKNPSKWPHFFLIKYIFRRYGKHLIMKSRDNGLFNWIAPNETNTVI